MRRVYDPCAWLSLALMIFWGGLLNPPQIQAFRNPASSHLPSLNPSNPAAESQVVPWVQDLLSDEQARYRVLKALRSGRLQEAGQPYEFFLKRPPFLNMLEMILAEPESLEGQPQAGFEPRPLAKPNPARSDALTVVAAKPEGPPHGMAFYGNRLILGAGAALVFYDISDSEPVKLGMQRVPFTIQDLTVEGDWLYVIGGKTLQIYDLKALGKRGTQMAPLPQLAQHEFSFTPLRALAYMNFLLMVTTAGVHIFDASGLTTLLYLGLAAAPFAFTAALHPPTNRLYVGTWSGMKIFDITDPTAPNELGSYKAPAAVGSFFATGDRAYVGLSDRVSILDVADPQNIQPVGTISRWATDIKAYRCDNQTTVLVSSRWMIEGYDPSDWSKPKFTHIPQTGIDRLVLDKTPCSDRTRVGGFGRNGAQFYHAGSGITGRIDFVVGGSFDTEEPTNIILPDPVNPPLNVFGVGPQEVQQVDWTSNFEQPVVLTTTFGNVGKENGFYGAAEVWVQAGRRIGAFGLNSAAGVTVQDITDLGNSYELAHQLAGGFAYHIEECGNYLFVATDKGEIVVLDKSDPQNTTEVARIKIGNAIDDMQINCPNRLYVAAGDSGFVIMDISDATNPKTIGRISGSFLHIGVTGNYACLNEPKAGGIKIFDISDPASPKQTDFLNEYDIDGPILDMTASDGYLHVSNRIENYEAYKIDNGKIKGPVAQQDLPGARSIEVRRQTQGPKKAAGGPVYYIYTANGDGGMYILEFNPALANAAPEFTAALPDTAVKQGETLEFDFDASDADGDSVQFVSLSLPAGATLDAGTGLFRWPVTMQVATGNYTVTVGATDGKDTTTTSASVTVVPPTGIADHPVPRSFEVHTVYPNPFADRLNLRYSSPGAGLLRITLYDVRGRAVRTFEPQAVQQGEQQMLKLNVQTLPAGLYFLQINARIGSHTARFTQKIIRLR